MSLDELDPEKLKAQMLKSAQRDDGTYYMNKEMIEDIVNYCTKQFNDASVRTSLNYEEYGLLVKEAISGLFMLVYIKHYEESENLLEKEPYFIAAQNWLHMMYRSVIGGGFSKVIIAENQSRVAPNLLVNR
jgi:hypothetical protein